MPKKTFSEVVSRPAAPGDGDGRGEAVPADGGSGVSYL